MDTTETEDEGERQRRRELRNKYHQKKSDLLQNGDVLSTDPDRLNQEVIDVDSIFRDVKRPREAALDSDLIYKFSVLGKQHAKDLRTNFNVFQPLIFVENAVTFMKDGPVDSGNPVTVEGWDKLGSLASSFISKPPTFHYMLGSFERGPIARRDRPVRQRREKDKETKTVLPQELKDSEKRDQEKTTEEVERVFKKLQEIYKDNGNAPVCYYEFVVNPNSFGLTIENIFHVAFLVKDGYAKIRLDETNLPIIEPLKKREGTIPDDWQPKRQFIMSITMAQWQEIKETFKISKELIPPRKETAAAAAAGGGSRGKSAGSQRRGQSSSSSLSAGSQRRGKSSS